MREAKPTGHRGLEAPGHDQERRPEAGKGTPSEDKLPREVWVVSGVVITGVIMSILDTTIVNVALETLARELHASLSTIQWVSTGYMLALAVVIPLTGWTSERFGAKPVWMTSVALFGICSALCGLAWSAESLIVFRILQGFGGGMIMPVGMSVLAQTAGPHRVGRVMSVVGMPMLLGPILGPVIGGLIVDSWSWRWIFYVNVPIAILALGLAAKLLHADAGRADAGKLDWLGLVLLSPGLAGVVFGLSETETHGGMGDPIAWAPIVVGLVLIAAFVAHAARAPRPLIDVRLFKVPAFGAASATTFLLAASLFGAMIILPLYYQVDRGESALTAGLLMAPQGLGAAMVMPIAGRLADQIGGGRVAVVGLVIATLGTLPFAFVTGDTPYALLSGVLVVRGIGIGSTMMPAMAAAYATLDSAAVPRATSALNVLQRVGGAIGTCVMAVVLQHEIRSALGAGAAAGGIGVNVPDSARARVADTLAGAFATTFWWAVGACLLALVPAVILARTERHAPRAHPVSTEAVEPRAA
jgi:EmrB/QacA subfamily drug resistance transporter